MEKRLKYLFYDTRVKRFKIRCKLACKRVLKLGTRKNMNKKPFFEEKWAIYEYFCRLREHKVRSNLISVVVKILLTTTSIH